MGPVVSMLVAAGVFAGGGVLAFIVAWLVVRRGENK